MKSKRKIAQSTPTIPEPILSHGEKEKSPFIPGLIQPQLQKLRGVLLTYMCCAYISGVCLWFLSVSIPAPLSLRTFMLISSFMGAVLTLMGKVLHAAVGFFKDSLNLFIDDDFDDDYE